jgi:hypothetical protein
VLLPSPANLSAASHSDGFHFVLGRNAGKLSAAVETGLVPLSITFIEERQRRSLVRRLGQDMGGVCHVMTNYILPDALLQRLKDACDF